MKWKISSSTRSDKDRRYHNTFANLKKASCKLGIGFWSYLPDRIHGLGQVLRLARSLSTA